eukprot:2405297-Pyramimonas_sp.AAC.1
MHAAKTPEGGPAHDRGAIMKAVGRDYKHYIAVLAAAGLLPRRPAREPGVFTEEEIAALKELIGLQHPNGTVVYSRNDIMKILRRRHKQFKALCTAAGVDLRR